jgi:hypothetical protein
LILFAVTFEVPQVGTVARKRVTLPRNLDLDVLLDRLHAIVGCNVKGIRLPAYVYKLSPKGTTLSLKEPADLDTLRGDVANLEKKKQPVYIFIDCEDPKVSDCSIPVAGY